MEFVVRWSVRLFAGDPRFGAARKGEGTCFKDEQGRDLWSLSLVLGSGSQFSGRELGFVGEDAA